MDTAELLRGLVRAAAESGISRLTESQAIAAHRWINGANDRRTHLLARMAGNIAGGIALYDDSEEQRQRTADNACDIAERILARIGL